MVYKYHSTLSYKSWWFILICSNFDFIVLINHFYYMVSFVMLTFVILFLFSQINSFNQISLVAKGEINGNMSYIDSIATYSTQFTKDRFNHGIFQDFLN